MGSPVPVDDLPQVVPPEDLPTDHKMNLRGRFDAYGNLSPEYAKSIGVSGGGWGSGVSNLAYKAGGAVSDFGTKMGLSPEYSAALGYGTNVLTQAIPALFGGKLAETAGTPLMERGAKSLMQGAVKPTLQAQESGDAARAIDTLLKEGVNPTEGGVNVLKGRIKDLNSQVESMIANSPESVKVGDVGKTLAERWNKVVKQATPEGDLNALRQAWAEFRNHPIFSGQDSIPVKLAHELKQGTYRKLGEMAYGEEKSGATEALKQLARGLREAEASAVPGTEALLGREGDLINAANIAQRRALMSGNRNLLSLAPLAGSKEGAIGFLADKSDLVKSLLARLLYSGKNVIPRSVGTGVGMYAGMQSGQVPGQDEQRQELVRQLRKKLISDRE